MASETLGLDDIMATVMSMGFDFKDCQDALTNGKLTAQAAIEWILAGKPGNVATKPAPSLNLSSGPSGNLPLNNQNNPFMTSSTAPAPGQVLSQAVSMGVDTEVNEDNLVSRTHLSDKQAAIKVSFEEKERLDMRKQVTVEKARKKLEKERILKEIQEDKERKKLTQSRGQASSSGGASSSSSSTQVQGIPSGTQGDRANIQVRLPSGQMFRETYQATDTLNTVWDGVYSKLKTVMNAYSGFIQPFPRKEYSQEEMAQSLRELGLVPSGSLVLKKKDATQATPPEVQQNPALMNALREAREERRVEVEPLEPEDMAPENRAGYQWGRGNRAAPGEEGQEAEEEMDEGEDEEGEGGPPPGLGGQFDPFNQIPGLGGNPILGGGNPNHHVIGVPMDMNAGPGGGGVFEGFGNRLVTAGVPGDHGAHQNRNAQEMAAEAAAQRFNLPRPPPPEAPVTSHPEMVYQVMSLQTRTMNLLAHRLTDPRQPIFSISGLPENLLQVFITYMKKEKMIQPKIMRLIPSYLLKLDLDYYPYTTNELMHMSRIFVNLHVLSLVSCPLLTDTGLACIKGMRNLKVLNLSGCNQITDDFFTVFKDLENIHSLHIDGTHVTDAGITELAKCKCTQLTHLDLSRTQVTHTIFSHLHKFKKLKSLGLKQTQISSLSGVDGVPCLESLDVSDTQIVTDSILCLTRHSGLCNVSLAGTLSVHGDTALSYLKDMKLTSLLLPTRGTTTNLGISYISGFHLSSLDLTNYTNIGDEAMVHVGKITSLKKLLLGNTKVTDRGLQYLTNLSHLLVLFLDRTAVDDAGASLLTSFKHLNELSLSATLVTDEFLKMEILNKLLNLTKVNLSRTKITDKGLPFLKMHSLQLLTLDGCPISPHMLSTVQENCPTARAISMARLTPD